LKKEVLARVPNKNVPINVGYIGPIIGASSGPGTLAVYFYGKEVTIKKND
jgi:fatty acid-binding protein DegV